MTGGLRIRQATVLTAAIATFCTGIAGYTSLASLSPTPSVGYLVANRTAALALVVALVVSAAVASAANLFSSRPWPMTSLHILGAWLGALALSSLFGLDPCSGAQVVGVALMGATVHVAFVRFATIGRIRAVLACGAIATIVTTVAGLVMMVTRSPLRLWVENHGRAAGIFVTANQFASYLDVAIFLAIALVWLAVDQPPLFVLGAVAAVLGSVALIATFSQAGWLGAGAATIFVTWSLRRRRLAVGIAVVLIALGSVLLVRPAAHHDPSQSRQRLRTWAAGLRVAEVFPLTGSGPMTYWRVYPWIKPPNGDPPGSFGALHPHSLYLSLADDLGIVGVIAVGYGWAVFGSRLRDRQRALREPRRSALAAVVASIVATGVQGVFDTVGVVELSFVWIPLTGCALALAEVPG